MFSSSAVNAENEFGQRTGFGIWISQSEFIVKQWNAEEEGLFTFIVTVLQAKTFSFRFHRCPTNRGRC